MRKKILKTSCLLLCICINLIHPRKEGVFILGLVDFMVWLWLDDFVQRILVRTTLPTRVAYWMCPYHLVGLMRRLGEEHLLRRFCLDLKLSSPISSLSLPVSMLMNGTTSTLKATPPSPNSTTNGWPTAWSSWLTPTATVASSPSSKAAITPN